MRTIGLDWHSAVPASAEAREEHRKEFPGSPAPEWMKPCSVVGAPKFGERETFVQDCLELLESRKKDSEERHKKWEPREPMYPGDKGEKVDRYYEHWKNMTHAALMEEERDKWDCERCPLLQELRGADSRSSMFLGITVSSCDFRGKQISADDVLDEELRERAYQDQSPDEMLEFADVLEAELESQKAAGNCEKASYEQYLAEYEADTFSQMFSPRLTEEEYEQTLHWREDSLKEAVHWLRTCAERGIKMRTSY